MDKYGLIGKKLSHSFSPLIHNELYKIYNIDAKYELIEISEDELEIYINKLRNKEYLGFNVTIPYKKDIMKYLDEIDDKALKIGSVNTIKYENGKAKGYNTDYYGFLYELKYYNVEVNNKDCYILGTGGASLAICEALKTLGGNINYVSRDKKGNNIISYDELKNKNIDVLVNTTPVGMYPNVGISPIDSNIAKNAKYVLDIIFNPLQTKLLEDANSSYNGLYMLVMQAVKAFEIWTGNDYGLNIDGLINKIKELI